MLSARPHRDPPIAAGLIILVSATLLMAPEFLSPRARAARPEGDVLAASSGATLRLLQFNLWEDNRNPAATLAWILAQNADVLTLEETNGRSRDILDGLRAAYPYKVSCMGYDLCDTAILSRRPFIAAEGMRDVRGRSPIAGAWAQVDTGTGPFTVAAIHLTWPILPPGLQKAQLASLIGALRPLPSRDRLILAGDFNSTPWSFTLRRLDGVYGLTRRTRALASYPAGRPLLFGWTAPFPVLPIDQVFAAPTWRTVSVTRGPKLGSDHYPVIVVLAPVNPASPPRGRAVAAR